MLTAVATKSLKIVIFNHLMLVDANCDDSVTIPRCPNLVVDLKVSVALKKNFHALMHAFWAPPYFKSWIHPCITLTGSGSCMPPTFKGGTTYLALTTPEVVAVKVRLEFRMKRI